MQFIDGNSLLQLEVPVTKYRPGHFVQLASVFKSVSDSPKSSHPSLCKKTLYNVQVDTYFSCLSSFISGSCQVRIFMFCHEVLLKMYLTLDLERINISFIDSYSLGIVTVNTIKKHLLIMRLTQ